MDSVQVALGSVHSALGTPRGTVRIAQGDVR
jgi:hypothetical protein